MSYHDKLETANLVKFIMAESLGTKCIMSALNDLPIAEKSEAIGFVESEVGFHESAIAVCGVGCVNGEDTMAGD